VTNFPARPFSAGKAHANGVSGGIPEKSAVIALEKIYIPQKFDKV